MFFRSLELDRHLDKHYENMDEQSKAYFKAYAAGINAYVKFGPLPLEFQLMGMKFEEWTVKDSILVMKFLSFVMATNWQLTSVRSALTEKLGQDLADRIVPVNKEYHFLEPIAIINDNGETPRIIVNASSFNDSMYSQMRGKKTVHGSNSWIIHGNYTDTGKAMLASDPHLGHSIPSEMYMMSMKFPKGHTLVGSTLAGIPGCAIGRSENFIWGLTMSIIENTDLYSLKLNDQGTHYWYNGKWTPLEIKEVTIKVKDEKDVKYKVKKTHHGPLLTSLPESASLFA